MNLFTRMKNNTVLKKFIRKFWKTTHTLFGIDQLQEQIDSLYYFLNINTDITKLPPAQDRNLRIMQECNAQMLYIFHKLCEKYQLTYWLDYGTLLGAVRHKGFIPWDDDLDVSMPREDYERVIPLMKKEMEEYGIEVRWGGYYDNMGVMARLAFAYKTLQTGVWLDIFPMDCCQASKKAKEMRPIIDKNIKNYIKYYIKHEHKMSVEQIKKKKYEIFFDINDGKNKIYYNGPEFKKIDSTFTILDEEDIFPLKQMDFEGFQFNVPANYNLYLGQIFGEEGEGFMSYPRTGVESHRDPDGGLAKQRATKHGINMREVLQHLKYVANKI